MIPTTYRFKRVHVWCGYRWIIDWYEWRVEQVAGNIQKQLNDMFLFIYRYLITLISKKVKFILLGNIQTSD